MKRLDYIDALRGLAILFIVFGHLQGYSYGTSAEEMPSLRSFTSMAQIPLFFFISGFLYSVKWLRPDCKNLIGGGEIFYLLKLAKRLLIPMMAWCALYCFWKDIPAINAVTDMYKAGYWFTFTLFLLNLVQMLVELAAHRLHIRYEGRGYAMLCMCMVGVTFFFLMPPVSRALGIWTGMFGLTLLHQYLYFVLGRLVRIHLPRFMDWKWREVLMSVVVTVFILLAVYYWAAGLQFSGFLFYGMGALMKCCAVIMIFMLFYRWRDFFSGKSVVAKGFNYIGRRTLDIYLLHYFFLPASLHALGNYFIQNQAMVVEGLVSMIITLAVIGVCIVCSELIRTSSTVSAWLLGEK